MYFPNMVLKNDFNDIPSLTKYMVCITMADHIHKGLSVCLNTMDT